MHRWDPSLVLTLREGEQRAEPSRCAPGGRCGGGNEAQEEGWGRGISSSRLVPMRRYERDM